MHICINCELCDHAHGLHYMCTSCIIHYNGWKAKQTGLYTGSRADYEVHGITHADTGFTRRRAEKGMHAVMQPLYLVGLQCTTQRVRHKLLQSKACGQIWPWLHMTQPKYAQSYVFLKTVTAHMAMVATCSCNSSCSQLAADSVCSKPYLFRPSGALLQQDPLAHTNQGLQPQDSVNN